MNELRIRFMIPLSVFYHIFQVFEHLGAVRLDDKSKRGVERLINVCEE